MPLNGIFFPLPHSLAFFASSNTGSRYHGVSTCQAIEHHRLSHPKPGAKTNVFFLNILRYFGCIDEEPANTGGACPEGVRKAEKEQETSCLLPFVPEKDASTAKTQPTSHLPLERITIKLTWCDLQV